MARASGREEKTGMQTVYEIARAAIMTRLFK